MKLTSIIISLVALFSFASADDPIPVRINTAYDDPNRSLDTVDCNNYLTNLHLGYTKYGSLPKFPNVAGIKFVTGPSSWACGTCWKITYQSNSIYVLAIGHLHDGVEISSQSMDALTSNKPAQNKIVWAEVVQADKSMCGMPV